jgi:hypothetical protein
MAISINLGSRASRRRWRIDVSAPPVEARQTGSTVGGSFIVLFSLIWGGFPTVGLVSLLRSGDIGAEGILFLVFPIVGLGLLAYGIHILLWRQTVFFDGHRFTVTERGLMGVKSWSEPLSAYDGVLRRTRLVRTKNSSYTLYMIDLVHPDPDRHINLYTDTRETGFREMWEEYAKRLRLPALEVGQGGMVRREAGDLDKSVAELIREGKVTVNYDVLSSHAAGLAVDFEGDDVVITRTGPQNPWWGSALSVLFPLVFVGVAVLVPDMGLFGRALFGGVGILFEVLFVIGVYEDLTSRARLRVGPDGVRVNKVKSRGETAGSFIPAGQLESVTIARKDNQWRPALVVASDDESLRFGAGLPRRSLDFAMNAVLGKIATGARHGPGH